MESKHIPQSPTDVLASMYISLAEGEAALPKLLEQQLELSQRILDTKRFINAHRPINTLPVELLIKVFLLVYDVSPVCTYLQSKGAHAAHTWRPMNAVCYGWRSIVLANPEVWWLVSGCKSGELVLSRRASLPVVVASDKDDSLIPFVNDHADRISALQLKNFYWKKYGGSWAAAEYGYPSSLPGTMPILRILNVWFSRFIKSPEGKYVCVTLSLDCFPQLRQVSFYGFTWGSSSAFEYTPPRLVRLELRNMKMMFTLRQLLTFVENCQELEILQLVRMSIPDDKQPITIRAPRTLRHLVVEDVDDFPARILGCISSLPISAHIAVTRLTSQTRRHVSLEACLPSSQDSDVRTALALAERVHVVLWTQNSVSLIVTASQATSLSLSVKQDDVSHSSIEFVPKIPQAISSMFARASVRELSFESLTSLGQIEAKLWGPLLMSFESLRKLAFVNVHKYVETQLVSEALHALTPGPTTPESDGRGLVCPILNELHITGLSYHCERVLLPKIRECLEKRATCSGDARISRLHVGYYVDESEWAEREVCFMRTVGHLVDVAECSFHGYVDPERERYMGHIRYLEGDLPESPMGDDI